MKNKPKLKLFIVFSLLFASKISTAQNPVNWTNNELLQPADLAASMQANKPLPIIYSVGPGAVIAHSINIGSVKEPENLQQFKQQLSKLPKNTAIVVYCGCCPFEHCPNIRPAVAALHDMKFTNYKVLNLEHNVKADWLNKGYPTVQ